MNLLLGFMPSGSRGKHLKLEHFRFFWPKEKFWEIAQASLSSRHRTDGRTRKWNILLQITQPCMSLSRLAYKTYWWQMFLRVYNDVVVTTETSQTCLFTTHKSLKNWIFIDSWNIVFWNFAFYGMTMTVCVVKRMNSWPARISRVSVRIASLSNAWI